MPYYFALKFKIHRTKVMKKDIRYFASKQHRKTITYKKLVIKYQDIEKAEKFNKQLLEEIRDEL